MFEIDRNMVQGGKTVYGAAVGILVLDTKFPRMPGDIGYALIWPFPVLYKVVRGASWRAIYPTAAAPSPSLRHSPSVAAPQGQRDLINRVIANHEPVQAVVMLPMNIASLGTRGTIRASQHV